MTALVERLRTAKALIGSPERWTKNTQARNADGRAELPTRETAVCWCGFGALVKVCGPREAESIAYEVFYGPGNIAAVNDRPETTHAEMMAYFDEAIARTALSEPNHE